MTSFKMADEIEPNLAVLRVLVDLACVKVSRIFIIRLNFFVPIIKGASQDVNIQHMDSQYMDKTVLQTASFFYWNGPKCVFFHCSEAKTFLCDRLSPNLLCRPVQLGTAHKIGNPNRGRLIIYNQEFGTINLIGCLALISHFIGYLLSLVHS